MARVGWLARTVRGALYLWFRLNGWTVEGSAPLDRKFVIIAAPHTSNWDFVYFLGSARALNLNLSFMGKASLFRGMFAQTMRELGGIPSIGRNQTTPWRRWPPSSRSATSSC